MNDDSRASIFNNDFLEPVDVSGFEPEKRNTRIDKALIKNISEESKFPSREAPPVSVEYTVKRRRVFKTGRDKQVNIKASQETVDLFNSLADELGKSLVITFERAVNALKNELDNSR